MSHLIQDRIQLINIFLFSSSFYILIQYDHVTNANAILFYKDNNEAANFFYFYVIFIQSQLSG